MVGGRAPALVVPQPLSWLCTRAAGRGWVLLGRSAGIYVSRLGIPRGSGIPLHRVVTRSARRPNDQGNALLTTGTPVPYRCIH